MNSQKTIAAAALIAILFLSTAPMERTSSAGGGAAPAVSAAEILKKVDDLWRGTSSHGVITMHVKTRHYTRDMRIEAWSKGRDLTLVRIISPMKEKGTATLKSDGNIYTYLPRTDRTIKITSGMMMSSWMGSHFTNDDLVKESRLADDYEAKITFSGVRGGREVIELTLKPREEAAVVWGRIRVTVRASDLIPIEDVYYDEDLNQVRTMTFAKVRRMGGRLIPTLLRLDPVDKPGESTELVYDNMTYNIDIPASLFTISELRRR